MHIAGEQKTQPSQGKPRYSECLLQYAQHPARYDEIELYPLKLGFQAPLPACAQTNCAMV